MSDVLVIVYLFLTGTLPLIGLIFLGYARRVARQEALLKEAIREIRRGYFLRR